MPRVDLNLLTALDALLTERSVTGAARRLNLSVSAMSRTLARLRTVTGDQLLLQAGRALVPTPYAERLSLRLPRVAREAEAMLRPPEHRFDAATLEHSFAVRAGEGFIDLLGAALMARIGRAAPGVQIRFLPKPDWDAQPLRDGTIDLEIGTVRTSAPEMVTRLQAQVGAQIEAVHGEDIAALFDIYVGRAHLYYNPKIRLERLIYRGIREAQNSSRSLEERERARRVTDLKTSLRDRAVYVDYHPIVVATTREIFGYEALARGQMRTLRSPEVMFEVAAEADLVWELSRLCRARALAGAKGLLKGEQLLFVNVDPHDFADPGFGVLDSIDPRRIVLEITERTAIKDYPKFRERLRSFRERGFRFAVDDAGSGYAGLGSIANLEPDFIKLDISLINSIDTNFIKQNLVETMVGFAKEQGAMVIAEGIERVEELETVKRIGVPLVQGFLLHHPARASVHAGVHAARD